MHSNAARNVEKVPIKMKYVRRPPGRPTDGGVLCLSFGINEMLFVRLIRAKTRKAFGMDAEVVQLRFGSV